ncbi:hypothetical protein [Arthrobacter crystallopoietes]|uniref:Heavy metal transporter n=1 Tax=Crystallibacter crystallopoietes TaxID=37928 RepID=A0A1H1FBK1_9MICC|nr:hypothetical protein [Arthrobacter crystallopoietes]AUI49549.1 hypothetical protein AC20117_00710 [Arthrobacter crystallopoietes]SDQ98218.1 hypothetical protein SAMN04489742_3355 [Arthrobacter crystallopoietes]
MARSRRRRRSVLVLLVLLALVGGGLWLAATSIDRSQLLVRERCTAVVGPETFELAPDQAANAALIAGISMQRGLPARAASIALATAIQESKLRNIGHGDDAGPDSRGLFQQRPTQGWGTEEQVMDPVYATNRFFSVLEEIPDYESLPITVAAQQVQRSAYPDAYADHEGEGKAFASALTGHSPAALNCVLKEAESAGDAAEVEAALELSHPGLETAVANGTLRVQAGDKTGWAVAQWAVASAKELNIDSVSFAGLSWQRSDGEWLAAGSETGTVVITVAGQP